MIHRLKPLLLAALVLGLSACAPRPQPPATPAEQPQPASPPQASPAAGAGTSGLQKAVDTAADLFNRGENELACEQVKRAATQAGASDAADPEMSTQLEHYRQACESN